MVDLLKITQSQKATLDFLLENGLVDNAPKCDKCGVTAESLLQKDSRNGNYKYWWSCRRSVNGKQHKFMKSIRTNSFFKGSRLNLQQLLRIIYCFCAKLPNQFLVEEFGIGEEAVVDWYSYLRQVCLEWALDRTARGKKIGGPGYAVEIDESKFGKRKYNMGRKTDGSWVFGGVLSKFEVGDVTRVPTAQDYALAKAWEEAEGNPEGLDRFYDDMPALIDVDEGDYDNDMFMFVVPDRTKETLIPILVENVAGGTMILHDCYKTYHNLHLIDVSPPYMHLRVNHSKTFKDPITGCCTNRIEGYWKHAKKSLPYGGTKKDLLPFYLARFIWFRYVARHNLNPFEFMLQCIKNVKYADSA